MHKRHDRNGCRLVEGSRVDSNAKIEQNDSSCLPAFVRHMLTAQEAEHKQWRDGQHEALFFVRYEHTVHADVDSE